MHFLGLAVLHCNALKHIVHNLELALLHCYVLKHDVHILELVVLQGPNSSNSTTAL